MEGWAAGVPRAAEEQPALAARPPGPRPAASARSRSGALAAASSRVAPLGVEAAEHLLLEVVVEQARARGPRRSRAAPAAASTTPSGQPSVASIRSSTSSGGGSRPRTRRRYASQSPAEKASSAGPSSVTRPAARSRARRMASGRRVATATRSGSAPLPISRPATASAGRRALQRLGVVEADDERVHQQPLELAPQRAGRAFGVDRLAARSHAARPARRPRPAASRGSPR